MSLRGTMIVDADRLQVEYAEQHVAVRIRNQPAGLVDRDSQLLGIQRVAAAMLAGEQEQFQHQLGQPVDYRHQRQHQLGQRLVDVGGRKGDFIRVGRGQGFRRHLGE